MDLIVSTVYNNSIFEELFGFIEALNISFFDLLTCIFKNISSFSPIITEIIDSYKVETLELFGSQQEAFEFAIRPENVIKYIEGKMGTNELLVGKARLFEQFIILNELLFFSVEQVLENKNLLSRSTKSYLSQLSDFVIQREQEYRKYIICAKLLLMIMTFNTIWIIILKLYPRNFQVLVLNLLIISTTMKSRAYIASQLETWNLHAFPLEKLLQNSNLNNMYRNFLSQEVLAQFLSKHNLVKH